MFSLRSQNAVGSTYGLMNDKSYTIGRDDCDIKVADKSVSKKHVEIIIKKTRPKIKDLKSSNGTVLNGLALKPFTEYDLPVGAMIQLGRDTSFIFQREELTVAATSLPVSDLKKVREICALMDYKFSQNWSPNITHVIVPPKLALTRKVVSAMIAQQHIVTMDFLNDRQRAILKGNPLPNESMYRISSWEDCMHAEIPIDYSADRRSLFKSKSFVFGNKTAMKKMSLIIKDAGGTAISTDTSLISRKDISTTRQEYLLIVDEEFTQSNDYLFNDLVQHVKTLNRRPIPDKEIPLAIIHASTEIYCNSYFMKNANLIANTMPCFSGATIVPETQTDLESQSRSGADFAVEESESSLYSERAYHENESLFGAKTASIKVEDREEVVNKEKPAVRMSMKRNHKGKLLEKVVVAPPPWESLEKTKKNIALQPEPKLKRARSPNQEDTTRTSKRRVAHQLSSVCSKKVPDIEESSKRIESANVSRMCDDKNEENRRIQMIKDVLDDELRISNDRQQDLNVTVNANFVNLIYKRFKKKRTPTYASVSFEVTSRTCLAMEN